jgi:hypothetical protein
MDKRGKKGKKHASALSATAKCSRTSPVHAAGMRMEKDSGRMEERLSFGDYNK